MRAAFIAIILAVVAHFGLGGRWEHRDHEGHHHDRWIRYGNRAISGGPPFLQFLNEAAQGEFIQMVFNENLTLGEQLQEMQNWAKKYSLQEHMSEFLRNRMASMEEMKRNITELIKYSPKVIEEAFEIRMNENRTFQEQVEAMRNLTSTYPEAFYVMEFASQLFMPKHDHHDRGHHGGHGHQHNCHWQHVWKCP